MKIMCNPLNEVITALVVKYVYVLIDVNVFIKRSKIKIIQNHKSDMTSDDIEKAILKLRQSTIALYQRYHEDQFSREIYILQKDKIKLQIDELEDKKLIILNGIGDKNDQDNWKKQLEDLIDKFKDKTVFTNSELGELIERVEVCSQKEIRVKWKFMDFTAKAAGFMIAAEEIAS